MEINLGFAFNILLVIASLSTKDFITMFLSVIIPTNKIEKQGFVKQYYDLFLDMLSFEPSDNVLTIYWH